MKVVDINEESVFTPVTLEITFESLDELKLLYALSNVSVNNVHKQAEGLEVYFDEPLDDKLLEFHRAIKREVREYL